MLRALAAVMRVRPLPSRFETHPLLKFSDFAPVRQRHAFFRGACRPPAVRCFASTSDRERRPLDQAEEALPFQVYSPTLNAAYWSRHTLTVARRSFKLCGSLLLWYLGGLLPWASRLDRRELLHRRAARLREVLVDLGAASVKIGQAISSRWAPRVLGSVL